MIQTEGRIPIDSLWHGSQTSLISCAKRRKRKKPSLLRQGIQRPYLSIISSNLYKIRKIRYWWLVKRTTMRLDEAKERFFTALFFLWSFVVVDESGLESGLNKGYATELSRFISSLGRILRYQKSQAKEPWWKTSKVDYKLKGSPRFWLLTQLTLSLRSPYFGSFVRSHLASKSWTRFAG